MTSRPSWLLLSASVLAAALLPGWWSAPLLGALAGALPRRLSGGAVVAGLAVMAGWGLRVGFAIWQGGAWPMADLVGRIIPIGAYGVMALTLVLGFLLASLAARTAAAVNGSV